MSSGFFSFVESLEARASMANWKFGAVLASLRYRLKCVENICAEDMRMRPLASSMRSNLTAIRAALTMGLPCWS